MKHAPLRTERKHCEVLKREKPDLVTLDLQMPNETGTRFYRNMTKDKEFKDIPVIVISGIPGRHLAVSKPVAVFEKPIDREALLVCHQKNYWGIACVLGLE